LELNLSGPLERRQTIHRQLRDNEIRIRNLEQQLQALQKLATVGTMAYMTAHEFNNLLVPIINYATLALEHENDTELIHKALAKVVKNGNNASQIIQSMLGLARDRSSRPEPVKLLPLIEECFQLLARDFAKDNITVNIDVPEEIMIAVVPAQFQQVILNLIINARQALLPRGGILNIKACNSHHDTIEIQIADTGCGIDPDTIPKIFEPFFTTKLGEEKPDLKGTGLGLSVTRDIIDAHKGTIQVTSTPEQGTAFTITLPTPEPTLVPSIAQ